MERMEIPERQVLQATMGTMELQAQQVQEQVEIQEQQVLMEIQVQLGSQALMAVLEQRQRSSTVRAATRVRALVLDREDLERLGRKHPAILNCIRDTAAVRRQQNKPADS